MNFKEHTLPELEIATGQVREALQCILHTILLYVAKKVCSRLCFETFLTLCLVFGLQDL